MIAIASGSFTRPADTLAYASGDLVANSTTAGSVAPVPFTVPHLPGQAGQIARVKIKKSGTGVANASFRVHLYRNGAPTVTNGDNGAWLSTESDYLGSIDVTVDKAFSNGAAGITAQEINFIPSSGIRLINALLEARAAYTPASAEVFTISLEIIFDTGL